jgi:hypothetical protein
VRPAALILFLAACLAPRAAEAQRARGRFEPTDLDLTGAGVVEIDLQAGYVKADDGHRIVAPDVEASLGIAKNAEIEIDTTYGVEDVPHFVDQTWVSLRLGIWDSRHPNGDVAWAAGIQAGPKLPTLSQSRGLGWESLAIVGGNTERLHVYGQIGLLLDPVDLSIAQHTRPAGVEGGFDVEVDLDDVDRWSLRGELGAVRFVSPHPDQIHATGGCALRVVPWLEVSVIGLVGFLPGGDRYGALLGVAPRFSVF